jgi:hypothetical protein
MVQTLALAGNRPAPASADRDRHIDESPRRTTPGDRLRAARERMRQRIDAALDRLDERWDEDPLNGHWSGGYSCRHAFVPVAPLDRHPR